MLGIVIIIAFWIKFGWIWGVVVSVGFLFDCAIQVIRAKG